jgi:hypothetical protein
VVLKLPVFVSTPSALNPLQDQIFDFLTQALDQERLQPRTLGRSDYPKSDPITEAYYIARACYGGLIVGFAQLEFEQGVVKRGTPREQSVARTALPTPWNHIEAGILVALRRPLLVFVENSVEGGVFDQGAYSGFLHRFSPSKFGEDEQEGMREAIRSWSADVRAFYRAG